VLFFDLVQLYNDGQLIMKIFVFLAVISFVKNHLGSGIISMLVVGGFFIFIFGDLWKIFGTLYMIYMLLVFGIASIVIDFFFVGGTSGQKQQAPAMESPVSSGKDIAKRAMQMQQMKAMQGAGPRRGR
jgi:hypothetical protein